MLTRTFLFFSFIICLLPLNLQAEEVAKKLNLSIGSYALTIIYEDIFIADDTLGGTALSASYALSNNSALRGSFYSLSHDNFSAVDADGIDIMFLFGTGFEKQGLKAYFGAGIYDESWQGPGGEFGFNGIQLNGGIGYNWDVVALDLLIGIREPGDYNSTATLDTAVVSSSFNLSARF